MGPQDKTYKRPESVLVVVYTPDSVLLLRRADDPAFWQSVTGSMHWNEADPYVTAERELREETGLDGVGLRNLQMQHRYTILPRFRARYAPEVSENLEHAFALKLSDEPDIQLSSEHSAYGWFSFSAAVSKVTSWSNRTVLEALTP